MAFISTLVIHRTPLLLFVGLVVGLTACDTSGSNSNNNEDNGEPIAKTFTVTVKSVSNSYPYSDKNQVGVAYAIDGDVGKVITLQREKTYEFELRSGVDPSHPFYIGKTAKGASGDEFRDNPAKKTTGTVTFTPLSSAPDSLFYQCDNHVYMGGKMEITN